MRQGEGEGGRVERVILGYNDVISYIIDRRIIFACMLVNLSHNWRVCNVGM